MHRLFQARFSRRKYGALFYIAGLPLLLAAGFPALSAAEPASAGTSGTPVLFVTKDSMTERTLALAAPGPSRLHYNKFWMDITRDRPFVDANGSRIVIPDTPTFRGITEMTVRFWHPRGEPDLLGAIVVKAYGKDGKPVKHGAFDRGVIVVLLSSSLFKGSLVRFDGIGTYIAGDRSLYARVLVRKTRQVALIPFADFMNDFTRQINTRPVVSWAVRRP